MWNYVKSEWEMRNWRQCKLKNLCGVEQRNSVNTQGGGYEFKVLSL